MTAERIDLSTATPGVRPGPEELLVLNEVLSAIRGVRHGTVTLIVQDGRVVQIDRTEKRRLVR
ncbi:MAG TPA: YezD family protein [Dehalococcoidia bacterium]|jgi:hypothetical protein